MKDNTTRKRCHYRLVLHFEETQKRRPSATSLVFLSSYRFVLAWRGGRTKALPLDTPLNTHLCANHFVNESFATVDDIMEVRKP